MCGSLPSVKCLLSQGVDINYTDSDGKTPFLTAVTNGHYEMVKYFLNENICDVNCQKGLVSPLQCAMKSTSAVWRDSIRMTLVEAGANVNVRDMKDHTLLMDSKVYKDLESRNLLLEHGVYINTVARDGCSVLWMAVEYGCHYGPSGLMDLFAMNLDIGISRYQFEGETPLQLAYRLSKHGLSTFKYNSICNVLLDSGCSFQYMKEYLSADVGEDVCNDMKQIRERILEMCSAPYCLQELARQTVLRAVGQGKVEDIVHHMQLPAQIKRKSKSLGVT